jgi:uncharacterized LabA/DUF88 family protein
MADQVVVFIDDSNVYRDARRCFFSDEHPSSYGRIRPYRYAMLLVERQPLGTTADRQLKDVFVYGGTPNRHKDPETYAAHRRMVAAWNKAGAKPIMRPLRYPHDWPDSPAQQKGVDVKLALDLLVMGLREDYDVAIVASTDTDLIPALEACQKLGVTDERTLEIAAWRKRGFAKKITVPGLHLWCHFLDEDAYNTVRDGRDYTRET